MIERFIATHVERKLRDSSAYEAKRLLRTSVLKAWRGRRLSARLCGCQRLARISSSLKASARPRTGPSQPSASYASGPSAAALSRRAHAPVSSARPPRLSASAFLMIRSWSPSGARLKICGAAGRFIKLSILLGQRRSETVGMRWSELNLEAAEWSLPPGRVKEQERRYRAVAAARRRDSWPVGALNRKQRFLLHRRRPAGSTAHVRIKAAIDARLPAGMPAWCVHDLRRSLATGLQRLGTSLVVVEKLLNHQSGSLRGVAKIYQRYDFADEKRSALESWSRHIEMLLAGARRPASSRSAPDRFAGALPQAPRRRRGFFLPAQSKPLSNA